MQALRILTQYSIWLLSQRVLLFDLFTFKRLLFVMYCYFAAVLFFASLIPRMTISSGVIPAICKSHKPNDNYSPVVVLGFAAAYFLFYITPSSNKLPLSYVTTVVIVRKQLLWKAELLLYSIQCLDLSLYFYSQLLISLSGDIEQNPGPNRNGVLKFCHWNLNSISAREQAKIPIIEAYNSIHHYDIFAISETMLNSTVHTDDIFIEGFSREIYRSENINNIRRGGVRIYYREGLSIRRRNDLELLSEIVCAEVSVARKKILFSVLYRSPSQSAEEFDEFISKLQTVVDKVRREDPYSFVLTGDFNCRSAQWWPLDDELPEGTALDDLIESNNLYQLIEEPTNTRGDCMTCFDLIITDQPNIFMDYGVHPSLNQHCQHQIVFGELNISLPSPPKYKRTVWDYSKSNILSIRNSLKETNWPSMFQGLSVDQRVELFTNRLHSTIKANIPSRVLSFNDKDPPWITRQVKTAIERKHRVFRKFMNSGRRQEEWENFKIVRNETSRKVANAKEEYFSNLGQKLSDPANGIKTFWSTMNRLINKKKNINVLPLLENGLFVTNIEAKTNIFNEYFVQMCSEASTGSTLHLLYQGIKSFLRGSLLQGRVFFNSFDLWIAKKLMVAMKFLLL